MKKSFITLLLFSLFCISTNAQMQPCDCPIFPNRYEPHFRNEIGISTGALYSPDYKKWGATAHIHYFRTISHRNPWSLGGFVEQAWLDGTHWTFAAGVKYQLFDHFCLSVLPGVKLLNYDYSNNHSTIENSKADKKKLFLLHFEVVYDLFHWGKIHFGPAVDYTWAKNHSHFMFGIHGAIPF